MRNWLIVIVGATAIAVALSLVGIVVHMVLK